MTNSNTPFLSLLSNPSVLVGIKYLILFMEAGFVFFVFMVRRQVLAMNKTFETEVAGLLHSISVFLLVSSMVLVFVTLLLLR